MKKLVLLILLLVPSLLVSNAQDDRKPPREKIEQLRIAFLTERLNLSVEEGQAFWPLYNEYESNHFELEKAMRKEMRDLFSKENPTEAEVAQMIKRAEQHHAQMGALRSAYLLKAMKILGPKRTVLLEKSDEDFKREVMKKLRDR